MSTDGAIGAAPTSGEPTDLAWRQYCEAVSSLGHLPQVIERRHLKLGAQGDSDLAAQRGIRDEQLAQSQQWRILAKRALSNAQARLVAAQVLIPDVTIPNFSAPNFSAPNFAAPNFAAPPSRQSATPAELVDRLRRAVADVDVDVAAVRAARRRVFDEHARDAVKQRAATRRRRRLSSIMAVVALAAVLLLVIWLI